MSRVFAVVVVVGLFAEARAHAQAPVVRGEDKVVYKKRTVIDASEVVLDGEALKPQGDYGLVRARTRFASMIQVRRSFTAELARSTGGL